jgi:hypothetical protein
VQLANFIFESGSGFTSGRDPPVSAQMPIKLPKGFARRKSSGNALEEVENPPQQSFRVFERPSVDKKSYSEGNLLANRLSDGQRFYPPAEDSDNIFAEVDKTAKRTQYATSPLL